MTIWQPDLSRHAGARYQAIADAIAGDVRAGRLKPGDRLPTHRALAWRLGVTVGTVTRAYAEAHRRGLVEGEVGRGTFVRDGALRLFGPTVPEVAEPGARLIDLSLNVPAGGKEEPLLASALRSIAERGGIAPLLHYQPHRGLPSHREAGAAWIARTGWRPAPEQVIVTAGGQHAMTVAFATLTQPGDTVLTEALTYPGMLALAKLLHLRLEGLPMDAVGILPDAFEAACRTAAPKALYALTTIQNPTGAVMSDERRRAIATVARRYGVAIVEDDCYGFLSPDAPPPLVSCAPEIGHYLTTLSKSMAPGLRIGFLAVPAGHEAGFAAAMRTTTWMAPPLMAEIAATWIADGTGDHLVRERRAESVARQEIARAMLPARTYVAHPTAMHGWLRLPQPWNGEDFAARARARGVLVTPGEAFAVSRADSAIRVCLGAARSRAELKTGLSLLVDLLSAPDDGQLSVV